MKQYVLCIMCVSSALYGMKYSEKITEYDYRRFVSSKDKYRKNNPGVHENSAKKLTECDYRRFVGNEKNAHINKYPETHIRAKL